MPCDIGENLLDITSIQLSFLHTEYHRPPPLYLIRGEDKVRLRVRLDRKISFAYKISINVPVFMYYPLSDLIPFWLL